MKWYHTYLGWVIPFYDWIDKWLKIIRWIGIFITCCISISHYQACKDRDMYKAKCVIDKTK